jgi:hypothetical protein
MTDKNKNLKDDQDFSIPNAVKTEKPARRSLLYRSLSSMYVVTGDLTEFERDSFIDELHSDYEKSTGFSRKIEDFFTSFIGLLFLPLGLQWLKRQHAKLEYSSELDSMRGDVKIRLAQELYNDL